LAHAALVPVRPAWRLSCSPDRTETAQHASLSGWHLSSILKVCCERVPYTAAYMANEEGISSLWMTRQFDELHICNTAIHLYLDQIDNFRYCIIAGWMV
jgi:hypothetical protein